VRKARAEAEAAQARWKAREEDLKAARGAREAQTAEVFSSLLSSQVLEGP